MGRNHPAKPPPSYPRLVFTEPHRRASTATQVFLTDGFVFTLPSDRTSLTITHDPSLKGCWVEDHLLDGWKVAVRLVPKDGQPVVAEVRVYPAEPHGDEQPGEWSGSPDSVPKFGLGARQLKGVRLQSMLENFPGLAGEMRVQMGDDRFFGPRGPLVDHGFSPTSTEPARKVGRPPSQTPLDYAKLSRDYERKVDANNPHPVVELAKERGIPHATMETHLRKARDMGMLSAPPPGRAGGRLTRLAEELLASERGTTE
jgi:hypothetical protein